MIVLFTDFGHDGPYVGQMHAVLLREAADTPAINLMADVPAYDNRAGAYLLSALAREFADGTVFLCVVDPGVGGARPAVAVHADGKWYVGPGNGLFELVTRRAADLAVWEVTWRPQRLSTSFHGRDLFAPVAARIARGEEPPGREIDPEMIARREWPDDLAEIIYIDHYGNAMTGLRAGAVAVDAVLIVGDRRLQRADTFSEVPAGSPFWYVNAIGLVEIAVNRGHAAKQLGLKPGDSVSLT